MEYDMETTKKLSICGYILHWLQKQLHGARNIKYGSYKQNIRYRNMAKYIRLVLQGGEHKLRDCVILYVLNAKGCMTIFGAGEKGTYA